MEANFDMNSNRVINIGEPIDGNDAVRLTDLLDATIDSADFVLSSVANRLLSNLADYPTARSNLSVYSTSQVDALVNAAKAPFNVIQPLPGDNTANITAAIAIMGEVTLASGLWRVDSPVIIPNGRRIQLKGLGDCRVYTNNNINLIQYTQTTGQADTQLYIDDIWFEKGGTVRQGTAVYFVGSQDTPGSKLYMRRCPIRTFNHGVEIAWCSASYSDAFCPFNQILFYLGRGSAFCNFTDTVAVSGGHFIFANDSTGDGISNGININRCSNVLNALASEDVFFSGFDAVFIQMCGFDLGGSGNGTGQTAVRFNKCSNSYVDNSYISSYYDPAFPVAVAARDNRVGILFQDSRGCRASNNTVTNNSQGVRTDTTGAYVLGTHIIIGNRFLNNKNNHISIVGVANGIISSCVFTSITVAGTNAPIYMNTAGADNWVITDWSCVFSNASYTISTATNCHVDITKQTWGATVA